MILTNWGYTLNAEAMPNLISKEDFNEMTGNKYAGDIRIDSAIASVEASIRNYVGWHLATNVECAISLTAEDGRVISNGRDLLIQLPCRYLTAIKSIKIDGREFEDYRRNTNGMLRLYDLFTLSRRAVIDVVYDAGLPSDQIAGVQELIANRVGRALSAPNGVQSEATGGISITYGSAAVNSYGAGALVDDNREVLIPFKLSEVF